MPDVLKLASFDLAGKHGQSGIFAFQGLHPGNFIGAQHRFALMAQFGSLLIEPIDLLPFFVKAFIGFRGQVEKQ